MGPTPLLAAVLLGGASAIVGVRHALRRLGKRRREALSDDAQAASSKAQLTDTPKSTAAPSSSADLLTPQHAAPLPRVSRRGTPSSSARLTSRQEFARGAAGALIPEATVSTSDAGPASSSSSTGLGAERLLQRRSAAGSGGLYVPGAFDSLIASPSYQHAHNSSEQSPDHAQTSADADGLDSSSQLDGSLDYSDDSDRSGMDPRHPGEPKSAKAVVVDLLIESALLISKPPLDRRHFDRETRQNLKKMRPMAAQSALAEIAERSWEGVDDITKEVHRMVSHAKAQDKYAAASGSASASSTLRRPVLGFALT